MDVAEKRKRKREKEVKKWTDNEVKTILTYMQEHQNIEKPTAQQYYSKLLKETKIEASWNNLKCKVRHLKSMLQNAKSWSSSTGEGVGDDDGVTTVKDKILKICPHYEQLSEVFSSSKDIEVVVCETSDFNRSTGCLGNIEESPCQIELDWENYTPEREESPEPSCFIKRLKTKPLTAVDRLENMELERSKAREKQLQLETEKFLWSKELEEKRLKIEEQKVRNDFELRKLELEQKERMFKYELDIKYKTKELRTLLRHCIDLDTCNSSPRRQEYIATTSSNNSSNFSSMSASPWPKGSTSEQV